MAEASYDNLLYSIPWHNMIGYQDMQFKVLFADNVKSYYVSSRTSPYCIIELCDGPPSHIPEDDVATYEPIYRPRRSTF